MCHTENRAVVYVKVVSQHSLFRIDIECKDVHVSKHSTMKTYRRFDMCK